MAAKYSKELRAKWAKIQSDDPDLIHTICDHIADGGTLLSLTDEWEVPFGWASNWLHNDTERSKMYAAALSGRSEYIRERVLGELELMGTSTLLGVLNDDGTIKPVSQWPKNMARTVSNIEIFEEFSGVGDQRELIGHVKKVRFWDKTRSLELLGKNLSLFVDRVHHSGKVSLEDLVLASQKGDKDEKETET